ncbi:MAG: hypothetical protein HZR80_00985 [Candidatus Heimdallarchaeota archaeon]
MNIIQKLIDITLKNRFYKWSRKRINRHQKRRIKRITSFAKRKSIYYKEMIILAVSQDLIPSIFQLRQSLMGKSSFC